LGVLSFFSPWVYLTADGERLKSACHSAWNGAKRSGSAESIYAFYRFAVVVGTGTAKALLVSGLPRATRSPRNDGNDKLENGKRHLNTPPLWGTPF
jgi:hypothetical protein